ncbi:Lrp/AsnC family transcriptional regulator [Chryseobacterium suipulveris]|uniref:Lrp/AsnC family transcriptional regulator n=1 Tax=Chryseobacterium suipulveris TaxID=2929800 RepID=A0ABY4BRD4_9FLAO|nr:Lrp/AsnC family transcriptional regulator [Chryseobacterium suipulveris]UOE41765.1 Lrp/AsnC family transcriptional regulator [Chryseobacterium suipulveris]
MNFDDKDRKLLVLLQENSKKTTKELANELNLSATAVFERIKKLERQKVIEKYVAIIDKKLVKKDFVVLCHVKLSQHSKEYITQFEKEIVKFPEILECFHVSGDYDYILKICMENIEEYREFMVSKLTSMQHIASTHSSFSIKEVKNTTVVFPD